jgi:hypothetical protein
MSVVVCEGGDGRNSLFPFIPHGRAGEEFFILSGNGVGRGHRIVIDRRLRPILEG